MTRLGYVYGNLMVNVSLKNYKLFERALTILTKAADVDRETAREVLEKAASVPLALIMLKSGLNKKEAARLLNSARGNVRKAIELSESAKPSGSRVSPRMR
jgi:N-acetylmuramic acid 6-phosphate etherase